MLTKEDRQRLGMSFPEDAFEPGSKAWWNAYHADLAHARQAMYEHDTDESKHAEVMFRAGLQRIDLEDTVDEALRRVESNWRVMEFFGLV